jgi:sulfatase maturation enzyme AslB (radical SAM superfamily)
MGGLAFRYGTIASCGVIHHGRGTPVLAEYMGGEVPFTTLFDRRREIADGSHPSCAGCPNLIETEAETQTHPVTWLGITHFNFCNITCHYCWLQTSEHSPRNTGNREKPYRILPIVEGLIADGHLAPNAIVDWGGGGEPTLMPDFDEAFALLDAHGTTQWLHSNAVRVPTRATLPGMQKSRVRVLCSLDAGSANTYFAIKDKNHYERVCENLATYVRNGAYVAVKYIMLDANCSFAEIEACLQMMKRVGCAEFVPDIDHDRPDPSAAILRGLAYARMRCVDLEIPYQLGSTGINNAREHAVHERVENEFYRQVLEASFS